MSDADHQSPSATLVYELKSLRRENPAAADALAEAIRQFFDSQRGPTDAADPSTSTQAPQAHASPGPDSYSGTSSNVSNALMAQEIHTLKNELRILTEKMEHQLKQSSVPRPSKKQPEHTAGLVPPRRRGRNLVVCIDGTSNQFSKKNTNVVELYSRLIRDEEQLTFYNSGIGTYATPSWKSWKYYKQVIKNKIDLAIAWNFDAILLSAYRWLSENYQPGDVIYLFGFSRGAYQIRTLAAMISSVGLLRKGNLDQIPFAYELYAGTKQVEDAELGEMCRHFKATFSEKDVEIRFAGAWDTVSSVGLVRNKTLPGTTEGMQHVKFFRHALALHERRVKFLPENVRGGLGPNELETQGQPPHTKEVWFAGSHGDIGGGAVSNLASNQFGPALRWMLFEAAVAGLRLTDAPQQWESDKVPDIHNSLTGVWRLFEYISFTRLSYRDETSTTFRLHRGRPRKIQPGQLIHATALQVTRGISWRARLPPNMSWETLQDDGMVEVDPYADAKDLIRKIAEHTLASPETVLGEHIVRALALLMSTPPGVRSLRDAPDAANTIMATMAPYSSDSAPPNAADIVADAALVVLDLDAARNDDVYYPTVQLRPVIARARQRDSNFAERLERLLAPAQVQWPLKHPRDVQCVSYMPEGDRIVSGCDDRTVRIWDPKTGQAVGAPMTGHTGLLCSAVSADGTQIASGSSDRTVHVWSTGTGAIVAILKGHYREVRSVAFSPDGKRVASGSVDRTIRVWDVASAKTVVGPIQVHCWHGVSLVAYSADGLRIAAGAVDAVHVWNAETGQELWQTVMRVNVESVAYSRDGKRIVAGCRQRSVYVLDAETGEIVLGPLTGDVGWTDSVSSVAFSPDGTKIASGYSDNTVRIWDAETGAELDVLRGHRNSVRSVAFSPNGKHVASASEDCTVRIWDATGEWKR